MTHSKLKTCALNMLKKLESKTPCTHENADTKLGNGCVWAKCEDCGVTFEQERWDAIREKVRRYELELELFRNIITESK